MGLKGVKSKAKTPNLSVGAIEAGLRFVECLSTLKHSYDDPQVEQLDQRRFDAGSRRRL